VFAAANGRRATPNALPHGFRVMGSGVLVHDAVIRSPAYLPDERQGLAVVRPVPSGDLVAGAGW
jgi:hypothetical protein